MAKQSTSTSENRSPYVTAVITTIGVIVAATITAGWWSGFFGGKRFTVLVREKSKSSENSVYKAKVSLEGEGIASTEFTDTEGRVTFSLGDLKKEIRIRVEHENFENYERRVVPAENPLIQEVLLSPKGKTDIALPSPPPIVPRGLQTQTNSAKKKSVSAYISLCRSLFSKRKYPEALAQCNYALQLEPSNQEAVNLKLKIENTVKILGQ